MALILIVDDDLQVRSFLSRLLGSAGYETLTASNGHEALSIFKEKHPDLVITDIVMPEQEGIATIIQLKKISPEVKIIAMSGGGKMQPADYLDMAKKLGAALAFEKPIENQALLAAIAALLPGQPVNPGNQP